MLVQLGIGAKIGNHTGTHKTCKEVVWDRGKGNVSKDPQQKEGPVKDPTTCTWIARQDGNEKKRSGNDPVSV